MSLGTAAAREGGYRAQVLLLGKYVSAAAVGLLLGVFITYVVIERGKGFGAVE